MQPREILHRFVEIPFSLAKTDVAQTVLKDVTKHWFTMGSSWLVAGFGARFVLRLRLGDVSFKMLRGYAWMLGPEAGGF